MSHMVSLFQQYAEELPKLAKQETITEHDLGIKPLIRGMIHGMPQVARYISSMGERIQDENYSGAEPIVIETFEAFARAVQSLSPVAEDLLKLVDNSPTMQALEERMRNPHGNKSDVGAAKSLGY